MITLSYSTINMLYTASHNWINKQMGLKQEERVWFTQGKEAHRLIQDHVCGMKKDERLSHLDCFFPIVEHVDFDPQCRSWKAVNKEFGIHGFVDGRNEATRQILEIKSSTTLWSASKYQNLVQRKVYAFLFPEYVESILITCSRDPNIWNKDTVKTIRVPYTDQDRKDAMEWIKGGIKIIETGDFKGGLVNGKCVDPYCLYGKNCIFK